MEYRRVGNRLAVNLGLLKLPISIEEILTLLLRREIKVVAVDILSLARNCIGVSAYRRGAQLREAPSVFDCSSFIKWLYGECGVWLPRRSIQQRAYGEAIIIDQVIPGDVVFTSGWIDYYLDDPSDGVGHVGIFTENNTVIHAANKKHGVIETELGVFIGNDKYRGVRRYIPKNEEVIILELPEDNEIETADDVKWLILQSL